LEAIQDRGEIRVEVSRALNAQSIPDLAQVKVSDTGIGIPVERQAEIFKPFFTTKEFERGTGLGLAVCKEIVAHHLGSISVESEIGKGACFTVLLPAISQQVSIALGAVPKHSEVEQG
jgi:two-component system, NtrC family, sensor kinase